MLEDQVAYLLQRYLGNYVIGLSKEALKISVWKRDVELTNMQLKPEALNALKLPVKVKAGFLGSVKLKVPWSRLGQEPVLVYLDRIFLLSEPATQIDGSNEDSVQEAKRCRIREIETRLLERAHQLKLEVNKSWLGSLVSTIIGNLKLSISNIHIRYEDLESNPGHPFATGISLGKLSAVTVDDNGIETFVTGGAVYHIQKSVELDQLAVYLDSDILPWHIDKPWVDLLPSEWVQVFRFGTNNGIPAKHVVKQHSYILQPVTGSAKYSQRHTNTSSSTGKPIHNASVNLDDVTLCLSKDGYRDLLKLADNFTAFNQRLKNAHYRPLVSIRCNPRSWWKYACKAVADQLKKASGKLSWEQVLRYARLQKQYISLYASLLKSDSNLAIVDGNKEIAKMDLELDIDLILQWRMLAHKFVEKSLERGIYSKKQKAKKSRWPFAWSSQSLSDREEQFHFTDEDWKQLNNLIGYKENNDQQSVIVDDRADTLLISLDVHMRHNASKLTVGAQYCLADLSCDGLDCSIKIYPEAKVFYLKLASYQLTSPGGLLAESAAALDSLNFHFCYKPFDVNVDWSMVAKASPCYITYLKDSVDEIIKFFEGNNALSQTMALDTAAAMQMTIDEVKRTAQQQVDRALKDHARFLLDLDIAAPKITIPTGFCPDEIHSTKLLLDLGNFVIRSKDDPKSTSDQEDDLYLQFDMVLSDVSAFIIDGNYHWNQTYLHGSVDSIAETAVNFLPVIDKCGVMVKLQQIQMKNPAYPSTRISVWLPSLGFHFSPARYHRLMQVVKLFQEDKMNSEFPRPWNQTDLEGWLFLLVWKGVANREAVWQRHYVCLVGPFLYILESPESNSYKQSFSVRGKQIYQIPEELVGGVKHVVGICDAGRPINKVVEDGNSLVLRFGSHDSHKIWQNRLQGVIYYASGSAPIPNLSETSADQEDTQADLDGRLDATDTLTIEKLFITGILDELKICFSYTNCHDLALPKVLLAKESCLCEIRAKGGQVELSIVENEMFIGTSLRSLDVEDLVCVGGLQAPAFIARSFIRNEDAVTEGCENGNHEASDSGDQFYEAPESLDDLEEEPCPHSDLFSESAFLRPLSFSRVPGLLPPSSVGSSLNSFVKAQIIMSDRNSSLYNNIDTQVIVTLATLSFFCCRQTLVALMEFVNAVNMEDENFKVTVENPMVVDFGSSAPMEDPISGLLGKGKSRIVFNLVLNMSRAQILVLNDDRTQLATLANDDFHTDIKIFPSSFVIRAALGNVRISDDSLPVSHPYFWICDMRNPGGKSFVELVFASFSTEDEDYSGYDYSLFGKFSEVRLVYLNRFVLEFWDYFMGLGPNSKKNVVKLRNHVTNTEKWFTTSEIEGSPALKLDLSLEKPIILMPRKTDSPDYLQLDVVHVTLKNTFQWIFGGKNEMNSIHVEILTILVKDINLNVGTAVDLGESIIQDVTGVSIVIRRSLRDLLHQIPRIEAAISICELKAALSSSEYQIISECAVSNISEVPNAIPPLHYEFTASGADVLESVVSGDLAGNESDVMARELQVSIKVSVLINLVKLSLFAGVARDSSLATAQVSGAWLLYQDNSIGDVIFCATLRGFTLFDDRDGTEDEFRFAVGNPEMIRFGHHVSQADEENLVDPKVVPTMLVLDVKYTPHLTFVSLCIQRLQLLVAVDFIVAVINFFLPQFGGMLLGKEELDPIHEDAIILKHSIYYQPSAEASVSPSNPLIVEGACSDHFIYDGNGGTLWLKDSEGSNLSAPSKVPFIFVDSAKNLQFKNVVIKNGNYLDSCIFLGSNSSYSAETDDYVYLKDDDQIGNPNSGNSINSPFPTAGGGKATNIIFEFQAIGSELTFYNALNNVDVSTIVASKVLHAQVDLFSRLVIKADSIELDMDARSLMMESSGIRILEPFDISLRYSSAYGKTSLHFYISDVVMNFTFSILQLFLSVEENILSFLRITSKELTAACSQFDKIGTIRNMDTNKIYVFWRPRAPPGFGVLGDCLTSVDKAPTEVVAAVNPNVARVKRPVSFRLIWPQLVSDEISDHGTMETNACPVGGNCSIWFPEAPYGFVALGCVVSAGNGPPSSSSVFCVSESLVSPCYLKDCINIGTSCLFSSTLAFWCVDNSAGTFLPSEPSTLNLTGRAYELRHLKYNFSKCSPWASQNVNMSASSINDASALQSEGSTRTNSDRFTEVTDFDLIWCNRPSGFRKEISIWRPVLPQGMVYFGDIAIQGYEPPRACFVTCDTTDEVIFKHPVDYNLVGKIRKHKGIESVNFWMPLAPAGFVSLGCVACRGSPKLFNLCKLRCVRCDLVLGDRFNDESLWNTSDLKISGEPFSIWMERSQMGTFIVHPGFKRPPRRYAVRLADPSEPVQMDSFVVDANLKSLSMAIFDDCGGLMVPLLTISLSRMQFHLHGRSGYWSSTASMFFVAWSYNDKAESWEPVIEPLDILLRFQYYVGVPESLCQLHISSTCDLNMNVSVSNINMLIQAYASWNNMRNSHALRPTKETSSPVHVAKSILDIHRRESFYVIAQNKLGQDIYIQATNASGHTDTIRIPSGNSTPLNVSLPSDVLGSHLQGRNCVTDRKMLAVVIAEAQLPCLELLTSKIYLAAIRLNQIQGLATASLLPNQVARTSGSIPIPSSEDDLEILIWNEMFFFEVDSLDGCVLEFTVSNVGADEHIGYFSVPLNQMEEKLQHACVRDDYLNYLTWFDISPSHSMIGLGEAHDRNSFGRMRCAIFLSSKAEVQERSEILGDPRRLGLIKISPSIGGPWTSVRLNYAAPSACWRLGSDVIASEVNVIDGKRHLSMRSLVSVQNDTDVMLDLWLISKTFKDAAIQSRSDSNNQVQTNEFLETQVYSPTVGWTFCSSFLGCESPHQEMSGIELPSGWEWIDDWHLDAPGGWTPCPDSDCGNCGEPLDPLTCVKCTRKRRWIRSRRQTFGYVEPRIPVGVLKPGDLLSLPLSGLNHLGSYMLQLRPFDLENHIECSWTPVCNQMQNDSAEIFVSSLTESDKLFHCALAKGTSPPRASSDLWFSINIQAAEVAKDINSNCIKDWSIIIKSPLSISNYLPFAAEYSVLDKKSSSDHEISCMRGVISSGDTVNVHTADIRDPLFLTLLPQVGWLPIHGAVLISQPNGLPSKTMSLRSSISGRTILLLLEQNFDKERPLSARCIRIYAPYWFSISRCPPLGCKLSYLCGKKQAWKHCLPVSSKESEEVIYEVITKEELHEGYTIASAINFNLLGLSLAISESNDEQNFGPVKDLSPLSDLDGSMDIYAHSADGNCMRLYISTKPCPYQSVPTKVISIRPFVTFTNRLGQKIFVKLNSEDEMKVLHAYDSQVSFVSRLTNGTEKLQVRLEGTDWSYPVEIYKEDTIYLVLKQNGSQRFVRMEIRGFEEGSRFVVIFRLGLSSIPIRIENRTEGKTVSIKQLGFSEADWLELGARSTMDFYWEDPYGRKVTDVKIDSDGRISIWKINFEAAGVTSLEDGVAGLECHVVDTGVVKVCTFVDSGRFPAPAGFLVNSQMENPMESRRISVELIVELGVIGISILDHNPKELVYLYLERVLISYLTGYDGGSTSRLKLIIGYLQLDNQLPLTLMPVLLAPEQAINTLHPVFKMAITLRNENINGILTYPYVYVRVTEKAWRLHIHEPIIWKLVDFYNNLQLSHVPQNSAADVDPEICVELIDVSEIRLKIMLETAPTQRPHEVLGIWSPIMSAIGNAFKIQMHLRRVMHRNRFMRKSSIVSNIGNRIWRDVIHNPLYLLFSIDVLGVTSSTLASLSKGFAELSTDGQFLQLRAKQVSSRKITGVSDGIIQGTEALAQGVAFGVSGVVTKPVESARRNGLFGFAHGLGRAFIGCVLQPASGALDFFSLTLDGIGASCSNFLEILGNKVTSQRIRNPRAIRADSILREYSEKEAVGQMILYLGEACRNFGCPAIFKEPSKFAWSDIYEDHFFVPYQRIVLVTNKRVMLLECPSPKNMDKKPSKIIWDVPWEILMAVELVKAGSQQPSHVLLHLKNFRRTEDFVRVIKCSLENAPGTQEPQAVKICLVLHRMWKAYQWTLKCIVLKVPSSEEHVCFAWSKDDDPGDSSLTNKGTIRLRNRSSSDAATNNGRFVKHTINFSKIWSSERDLRGRCRLCRKQFSEDIEICSIWRPICPDGYVSIGDIARTGSHAPNAAAVYHRVNEWFVHPLGYDLVWRNCSDEYKSAVSIWHPRAPEGYVAPGCVAVDGFTEPEANLVHCVAQALAEEAEFEEHEVWSAPGSYPWACHIYQVNSDALHFVALRQGREDSDWKPFRVVAQP